MVQLATSDTMPPSADEMKACDQDCQDAAVFAYRWEWGATGFCCAAHGALLQQTSTTLKRSIALHPIAPPVAAPLLRDERIQLTARSLVLEAEVEEARSQGLSVYRKNGDLQVQLSAAVVKERELKAQLTDAGLKLQAVERQANNLEAENGRLLVELERLRELDTFVSAQSDREANERGLGGGESPDGR